MNTISMTDSLNEKWGRGVKGYNLLYLTVIIWSNLIQNINYICIETFLHTNICLGEI